MTFNKWTLGLAAVGAVSLASVARADETKLSQLNTAISNTTISGVVDVGAQWNLGNAHNPYNGYYYNGNNTVDNFSLNQVIVSLDKPLDESPWASGYHLDLNWGQSAVGILSSPISNNHYYEGYGYGSVSSPVRQAYVTMRTPIGNGITWKAGLFDNIIGYEVNTLSANPNYSHSMAYGVEATSHLGLIGTYNINEAVSVTAGLANSYYGGTFGSYYGQNVSEKTFLAAATFTAPESWGWAQGAQLTVGANLQIYKDGQDNYYAGLTLPTPVKALKVGVAFDLIRFADEYNSYSYSYSNSSEWIVGAYASFDATEKLQFNVRGEYNNGYDDDGDQRGEAVTLTARYKFWENVVSRVELRWDHMDHGVQLGWPGYNSDGYHYNGARENDFTLAFNVAYQF